MDAPIDEDRSRSEVGRFVLPTGKPAQTECRVVWANPAATLRDPRASPAELMALDRFQQCQEEPGVSLIRCHPITGRTHQIRVHVSHVGHPIVGDDIYGPKLPLMPRQALHARSIAFDHPITGQQVLIIAPVPADMMSALRALGFDGQDSEL